MEQLLTPPPQLDSAASDNLKDDIIKILHEKKLTVEGDNKAPFLFDWASISAYNGAALKTVLTAVKNNAVNICNQISTALEKVDLGNRPVVNTFILAVALRNAAGKSSNSKAVNLSVDGILSVYTIFEDNLNCANYLERKVITALNEFRPPAGVSAPQKVEIKAPAPFVPEAAPVDEAAATTVVEVKGLDLTIPVYADATADGLKRDILKALEGQKLKLDPNYVPGNVTVSFVFDWTSVASYSGGALTTVLRAVKNGIANICGQVSTAYDKANRDRLGVTSQFITLVVIQNIPGKSSNDKKASMHVEGHLLVNTIFEDSMNCTYYIEKKVITAIDDFRAPPGVNPPPRPTAVPTYVAPPAAAVPAPTPAPAATTTTTTTSSPAPASKPAVAATPTPAPAATPTAPVAAAAAPTPAPAAAPAKPAPEAKPKGRSEFEGLPYVEDATIQHLMREIQSMAKSQSIVLEHKGTPIGAPIVIDWGSFLVYSGAKQSTVIRNLHNNILRLSRDIVHSVKLACTDPNVKPSVLNYLRSVAIRNVQGTASSAKKVLYEDGHLTLESPFEDAANCALYFESKITNELGARAKGAAPPKPEADQMIKEEIEAKLHAHYDKDYKKLIPPTTVIEIDYSTFGKTFAELAPNAAASVTQMMQDYVAVINALKEKDFEEYRAEIKKIAISHVASHKTDDKRKVDYLDDNILIIQNTFDDKIAAANAWREKFTKGVNIILKKIHIRDHLMPQYTLHVSEQAKQVAQVNPWIPIKSYPTENPVITCTFDWKSLHHFTHTQDFIIDYLDKIIKNLESDYIEGMLTATFGNVCNYDVGKHAVQSFVKSIILRENLKPKDERYRYGTDGVLQFETTFHDPKSTTINKNDLIVHMKERLSVAHPCAVQDAYHHVVKNNSELATQLNKPGLPLIIDWDSFVPKPEFQRNPDSYNYTHRLVVDLVRGGLLQDSVSMVALSKDPIVMDAITKKIDKIIIRCDPTDNVEHMPGRIDDPAVKAHWEDKTTLVFTQNVGTAYREGKSLSFPGWGYVMEVALETRPPKVQRHIAKSKPITQKLSSELQALLGFPIAVDVDYEEFIHTPEFAFYLDEKPYHYVIDHAAYNVPAILLEKEALGDLQTYKTVVALIKERLTNVVVKVSAQGKIGPGQVLTYAGKTLTINLNMNDLAKPSFDRVKYANWRLPLEALLNLRDAKVQEEIAVRVDVASQQNRINAVTGGNAYLKIKWETFTTAPAFANNKTDYIAWLHTIGEVAPSHLSKTEGLGRLCEYEEVKKHIAGILKGIELEGEATPSALPWGFTFNKGTGILTMTVNVAEIHKQVSQHNGFYNWGYPIEQALGIRHLIVQGTIDRTQGFVDDAATRLTAICQNRVKAIIDWDTVIKSPQFNGVQDYKPVIEYISHTPEEWLGLAALITENHGLLEQLKENVHTFLLVVDPDSKVNESEFKQCEYGVSYANVKYQNPEKKDVLIATVNWFNIQRFTARGMELDLKTELLLTPRFAADRLEKKKQRAHEKKMQQQQQEMINQQARAANAMEEQAYQTRRLNDYFRY